MSTKNLVRKRPLLLVYDSIVYLISAIFVLCCTTPQFTVSELIPQIIIGLICVIAMRVIWGCYRQIWRYGGATAYLYLIFADTCGGTLYFLLQCFLPFIKRAFFIRIVSLVCISLLISIVLRIIYHWLYQHASRDTKGNKLSQTVLRIFAFMNVTADGSERGDMHNRIRVAIVGASRIGTTLATELLENPHTNYIPVCYIDTNEEKIGRVVEGLPVLSPEMALADGLQHYRVQEIIIALPQLTPEEKNELYATYQKTNCKIKLYDYPTMQNSTKRQLREFSIEDLLFRDPVEFSDEATTAYYRDKVILITGGGGSIGSELCRQIAKMHPRQLIILDVYENGAYDVQQELRIKYGKEINLQVEICSVCDRRAMDYVFSVYRPQIVLNAAAHKHVPLMEHNCVEAVKNNVFGTLNTVQMAEKYETQRLIMVSTDKAVMPTNVMGATKRMCEMLVLSRAAAGTKTVFSCTRFGNVLGSAGSVIPLFKRQIAAGGPITLTDKRIIRYFMTIPEAAQLVLQSGAMAKNGELFVLDMGKPIKILDLAENMIRLSGFEPYKDIDIQEIGLRPGEKLYEELLMKSETLTKTENKLIFIERDTPCTADEIAEKLKILHDAVETENNELVKEALHKVVPTFRTPEEINAKAMATTEMNLVKKLSK